MTMNRIYPLLPEVPEAGLLERYQNLGIIVPLARTNLVTNPSLETNLDGWDVLAFPTTINQGVLYSYTGRYSLECTPNGAVMGGIWFGPIDLPTSTTSAEFWYAVGLSFRIRNARRIGYPYVVAVADGSGNELQQYHFVASGEWQRIAFLYKKSSSAAATIRLVVRENGSASSTINSQNYAWFVDAVQVENCADGYLTATTYIDGDQTGLVPNSPTPAYGWNATPHASTSYRSAQTRAGGRILTFAELGLQPTQLTGFGMTPPDHQTLNFAQLDGAQYQNTLKPPRTLSLSGRWQTINPTQLDQGRSQLSRILDRDLVAQRQPLLLTTQAEEHGEPIGDRWTVPVLYTGGLEGNTRDLPSVQDTISFQQFNGGALETYDTGGGAGTSAAFAIETTLAYRTPTAESTFWYDLPTSIDGAVRAIVQGLDGLIYIGGDFTTINGTGGFGGVASYDPSSGTFSALASGLTGSGGVVYCLAIGSDGTLYAGGSFTASPAYLAKWNGSAWVAIDGTGQPNNTIFSILPMPNGTLYVGGAFTAIGAGSADYVAYHNGTAWSSLGSDTAFNATVRALVRHPNGRIYIGGSFTNAGSVAEADYVASWNGSSVAALSTGMNAAVYALLVAPDGLLYAGGAFSSAGGQSITGIASWNGVTWSPLGPGITLNGSQITTLANGPGGVVYAIGMKQIGPVAIPCPVAAWNGANWWPLDLYLGTEEPLAILPVDSGGIYLGRAASVSGVTPGVGGITNSGTMQAWPTLTITCLSGQQQLHLIENVTTGAALWFDLLIRAGETITIRTDPLKLEAVSDWQGNILKNIVAGSVLTNFFLQPGLNLIAVLGQDGQNLNLNIVCRLRYASLDDVLYQENR